MYRDPGEPRPINWGQTAIALCAVLILAIVLAILVITADFGDRTPTTVPKTPGACAPFCTATPDPPQPAGGR